MVILTRLSSYAFDNFNKSTSTKYAWNSVNKKTSFAYDLNKDNALATTTFPNNSTLSNTYDTLGRVAIQGLTNGSHTFNHVWNYKIVARNTPSGIDRSSNVVDCIYYRKDGAFGKPERAWQ